MTRNKSRNRGFSTLELVIVVAILMIVAALAIPNMMEAVYDARLRSAATDLAGLMQQARQMAIKDNTFYPIKSKTTGGVVYFFVDTTALTASPDRIANTAYSAAFPTVQLGGGVVRTFTNPDSGGTSTPWAFTPLAYTTKPYWGPMGLPCIQPTSVSAKCATTQTGGAGNAIAGYQILLTDNRRFGTPGIVSVTASPGGRVRVWKWTGSVWQ